MAGYGVNPYGSSPYGDPFPTLPALTKNGIRLQVNGANVKLSGVNNYSVGYDDNGPAFPSQAILTSSFAGMREMGCNIARTHTVGISAGTANSYLTGYSGSTPVYNESNLASADWAVYQATLKGIYLMVPLTDIWNYYHSGLWWFVHQAYIQNPSGITDVDGSIKGDSNNNQFFANTAGGLRIRALFKGYISKWLNHVNPNTGLANKDDPAIAILETGNEMYPAAQLGTNEWTQDIASYIKSIAPNKLVADGTGASGQAVSTQPGLTASAVDIMCPHYYPQDPTNNYNPQTFSTSGGASSFGGTNSARQQLSADVTAAINASRVFLVGEYPWTRSDIASWWSDIESNTGISGDMTWTYVLGSETHGGAFGTDDFSIHRPYLAGNEATYGPALSRHISTMSGVANTNNAGGSSVSNPNILPNADIAGVEGVSTSRYTYGVACTATVDTSTYASGTSSLKAVSTASGYAYYYFTNATTDGAPVTPGNQYTATFFAKDGGGWSGGVVPHITWFKSNGDYISGNDGSTTVVSTTGFTQLSVTATAPAGAAFAVPQIQSTNSIGVGAIVWVDNWGIFAGGSATPYTLPGATGGSSYSGSSVASVTATMSTSATGIDPGVSSSSVTATMSTTSSLKIPLSSLVSVTATMSTSATGIDPGISSSSVTATMSTSATGIDPGVSSSSVTATMTSTSGGQQLVNSLSTVVSSMTSDGFFQTQPGAASSQVLATMSSNSSGTGTQSSTATVTSGMIVSGTGIQSVASSSIATATMSTSPGISSSITSSAIVTATFAASGTNNKTAASSTTVVSTMMSSGTSSSNPVIGSLVTASSTASPGSYSGSSASSTTVASTFITSGTNRISPTSVTVVTATMANASSNKLAVTSSATVTSTFTNSLTSNYFISSNTTVTSSLFLAAGISGEVLSGFSVIATMSNNGVARYSSVSSSTVIARLYSTLVHSSNGNFFVWNQVTETPIHLAGIYQGGAVVPATFLYV